MSDYTHYKDKYLGVQSDEPTLPVEVMLGLEPLCPTHVWMTVASRILS